MVKSPGGLDCGRQGPGNAEALRAGAGMCGGLLPQAAPAHLISELTEDGRDTHPPQDSPSSLHLAAR